MTTNPVLEVRALSPSEWRTLRTTRLRAVLDSPHAFTSTYTDELTLDETQWRERFENATWLVAFDGRTVIGLAGLVGGTDDGPHVESIWVAPGRRQLGVFRSLLDRLVEIGRSAGLTSVFLWVVGANQIARCAYTRVGFVPTGEEQPLPSDGGRVERRLRLDV